MSNHPTANLPFEPWYPEGSNTNDAPDYYFATIGQLRGEVVRLWRYGDEGEDRWLWTILLMGTDSNGDEEWLTLRKATVTYTWHESAKNAANEAYRTMFGL